MCLSGEAKFLLALAFQEGNGVPKKLATAIEWLAVHDVIDVVSRPTRYKAVVHAEQQTIDIAMSRFQSYVTPVYEAFLIAAVVTRASRSTR
jgi:hypothetical protein